MHTTRGCKAPASTVQRDQDRSRAKHTAQPVSAARQHVVEGPDRAPDAPNRPCGGYMIGSGTFGGFTLGSGI